MRYIKCITIAISVYDHNYSAFNSYITAIY